MPQNDEILPLDELERRAIVRALHESGGDKLAAARLLGVLEKRRSTASLNCTARKRCLKRTEAAFAKLKAFRVS